MTVLAYDFMWRHAIVTLTEPQHAHPTPQREKLPAVSTAGDTQGVEPIGEMGGDGEVPQVVRMKLIGAHQLRVRHERFACAGVKVGAIAAFREQFAVDLRVGARVLLPDADRAVQVNAVGAQSDKQHRLTGLLCFQDIK